MPIINQKGGGSASVTLLLADVVIAVPGADAGASTAVLFNTGTRNTTTIVSSAATGPETAAAADEFWFSVATPVFASGTLTLTYGELLVGNGAGTQKLIIATTAPAVMASNSLNVLAFANTTTVETIGADLTLVDRGGGNGSAIKSTAGGQFFARVEANFTFA